MSKVLLSPATLVGGSLAGALLLALYLGTVATDDASPPVQQRAAPEPPAVQQLAAPAPAAAPVPAAAVAVAGACPTQALSAPRAGADGRFALEPALASGASIAPDAFLTVAREAEQEGRLRDAEVALLAACHSAERTAGAQSVQLADVKTQIGQHYVALAARAVGPTRQELLQRAGTFFTESAISYAAALGKDAAKTRKAEQRIASLHDPATLQLARSEAGARGGTSVMGAAPESAADIGSGSCTGSASRRLVCSDPELAQLENDMLRLRAQVSSVTRDPAGLRQRDQQALARRDAACQDRDCLLRWYAQRRKQLLDEF